MTKFLLPIFLRLGGILLLAFSLSLAFSKVSRGDDLSLPNETSFKFGLGIFNSAKDSPVEMKQISVSYEERLFKGILIDQWEIGAWEDSRRDMGRKDSLFGSYSLGVPVDFDNFFMQGLYGVALISSPDSYLGGILEFKGDLIVGIKDSKNNSIGLDYSHTSNAGIFKNNMGRDVLSIRLGVPF